jgi:O-antigen ligase
MRRSARLSVLWFSAAVVLTTATQLRLERLPLGPGEGMLLAWIFLQAARALMTGTVRFAPAVRPIVRFWVAAVVLLLAGWLVGMLLGVPPHGSPARDLLALLFSALAISAFALQPELTERVGLAAKSVLVAAVVPLAILAVAGVVGIGVGPIEVWYVGFLGRFQGWADNPNQTSFLLTPLPLFGVFVISRSRGPLARVGWGALVMVCILLGVWTQSDGLLLAWLVSGVGGAAVVWCRFGAARRRGYVSLGLVYLVLPVFLLVVAARYAGPAYDAAENAASALSASRQGSERLLIWANGLKAIAASPAVGLGPGAHSGRERPFLGLEVHNTYIDWGTNTGVLGVLFYLALLVWAGGRAWRAGEPWLVLALVALGVFSAFHFVLRQPAFWLYLTIVAFAAGKGSRRSERAPVGGRAPDASPAATPGPHP